MHTRTAGRHAVTLLMLPLAALALLAAAGCQKALFAEDQPRSQYDRFDAIRDNRAQTYVEDEFGRKRPNIRGRLVQTE